MGPGTAPVVAEALVDAPAELVRARIGRWSTVTEDGPGRSRVRMETDSLEWPAFALGALGAEVTVVSPPALLDLLHEWGRRFVRAGASGSTT
jgi:hypothetical protein